MVRISMVVKYVSESTIPGRFVIHTDLCVRDKVIIDGDSSLIAVITAIIYRNESSMSYEISWVGCGKLECCVIEGWRLKRI